MPSWSNTSVCGSRAAGSGSLYSVTSPVLGSSLPIRPAKLPVNQMLPSLSSARPCGAVCARLSGYSFNSPVLGSRRPSLLESWPVYQTLPSRAAIGSCGREPGVGIGHSWIAASAGPAMAAAVGRWRGGAGRGGGVGAVVGPPVRPRASEPAPLGGIKVESQIVAFLTLLAYL